MRYLQTMDSYVANSMKEAGFRQAVMGRYPSETVDVEATDDNTLLFTIDYLLMFLFGNVPLICTQRLYSTDYD